MQIKLGQRVVILINHNLFGSNGKVPKHIENINHDIKSMSVGEEGLVIGICQHTRIYFKSLDFTASFSSQDISDWFRIGRFLIKPIDYNKYWAQLNE